MSISRDIRWRRFFCLLGLCLGVTGHAGELYVGANYHPHDSNPETWARDIQLMREGGFRVVRMGHLAWDSYEPKDGQFNVYGWFRRRIEIPADCRGKRNDLLHGD